MDEHRPPDDDSFAHASPRDLTGSVQRAVARETSGPLSSIMERLRNMKWLVSTAGALILLGGAGVVWFGTFARAADVMRLDGKLAATDKQVAAQAKELEKHIATQAERDHARDLAALRIERQLERQDDHMEWQDRQLLEVAKASGAKQLQPPPKRRIIINPEDPR